MLEKKIQFLNGKNWRDVNVLNLQFDHKESSKLFGTYKELEELFQQITKPNQMVISSYKLNIDKLLKTLTKNEMSFSQNVKKLFIISIIANADIVKEFIGSLTHLQQLHFQDINDAKWLTHSNKLENLTVLSIQQVSSSLAQLGKKIQKFPNLLDLQVGLQTQLNKSAATFFQDISFSKSIKKLMLRGIGKIQYGQTEQKINKESENAFIESGKSLGDMKNLETFQIDIEGVHSSMPLFLKNVFQSRTMKQIYFKMNTADYSNFVSCIEEFKASQASEIYFKYNFEDYDFKLPKNTFDALGKCSKITTIHIDINRLRSAKSVEQNIKRKLQRLVSIDYSYY